MGKILVITEKPSVATDISKALKVKDKNEGYFENDTHIITWAIGHLLELQNPEDIDKKYKPWLLSELPIIPSTFKYKVVHRTRSQYKIIKTLLKRKDIDEVVNGCDAGREGELIFREIIEKEKVKHPQKRLWLSSMTKESILNGFENLEDSEKYEGLAAAAKSRSESDWLIGINGTRAITKRLSSRFNKTVFTVGRVQTPTLSMLVKRELEIMIHVPKEYFRIKGDFSASDHKYQGQLVLPISGDHKDRIQSKDEKDKIISFLESFKGQATAIETRKDSKQTAYPLFDLTSLQREANTRFGISASRTLKAAQRLYEQHKMLTYPRTDSKHLPEDYVDFLKDALSKVSSLEVGQKASSIISKINGKNKKVFDSKKVSDHFAIIPTGEGLKKTLEGDDKRIYELVVKRTIAIFYPDAVWENLDRKTLVGDYTFQTKGRYLKILGWREVFGVSDSQTDALNALKSDKVSIDEFEDERLMTKPPARIGEARLLSLMEYAGKTVEDESLMEVMDGKGIGTPATRADIIEKLIYVGYVSRVGNSLRATSKAIRLLDVIQRVNVERLSSVELTANLETDLQKLESGELTKKDYDKIIVSYVKEVIGQLKDFQYEDLYAKEGSIGTCPKCQSGLFENMFGYACEKNTKKDSECDFMLHKDYCGKLIHSSAVSSFLEAKKTDDTTLIYPDGKTFVGKLEMNSEFLVEVLRLTDDGQYESIRAKSTKELQEKEEVEFEKKVESKYLSMPGTFKKTNEAFYFEGGDFPKVLGKRPKSAGDGPFVGRIPLLVCKRPITEDEALQFFQVGKTELLTNFISKRDRPFNAMLFVKANGKYGFEFEPRKKKEPVEKKETEVKAKATTKKKAAPKKVAKKK